MEGGSQSLLVVEDDEATRGFLSDNLAADGFRVATATAAGEALRAIEVRRPDLVVLDLILEDGDGLKVLDRVRSADGMASRIDPALPVIVVTGRSGEADRVRGFARGADDYLLKPFAYGELLGSDFTVRPKSDFIKKALQIGIFSQRSGPNQGLENGLSTIATAAS